MTGDDEKVPIFNTKATSKNLALNAIKGVKWPEYQITKAKEWIIDNAGAGTDFQNFFDKTYTEFITENAQRRKDIRMHLRTIRGLYEKTVGRLNTK